MRGKMRMIHRGLKWSVGFLMKCDSCWRTETFWWRYRISHPKSCWQAHKYGGWMLTSQHVLRFGINPLLCLKTGLWNDMSRKYFNHLRRNICIYAFSWISRRGIHLEMMRIPKNKTNGCYIPWFIFPTDVCFPFPHQAALITIFLVLTIFISDNYHPTLHFTISPRKPQYICGGVL